MKLALAPSSFDVMLTENMFGDILSDEAGAICGSLGLLPSASLGPGPACSSPCTDRRPTLAGRDIANPIGAILSAAMLLADGLGLHTEAPVGRERAWNRRLRSGVRTADIAPALDSRRCGTKDAADTVGRLSLMSYSTVTLLARLRG